MQLFDLVTRAFGNYSLKQNNATVFGYMEDSLDSARFYQAMPFIFNPDILAFVEGENVMNAVFIDRLAAGALLYPIAMTLQLPVYTYLLVLEKKKKLTEMMKMHGMKDWHYYFTNYCFCFFLYTLVSAFFWLSGIAVQLRYVLRTSEHVRLSSLSDSLLRLRPIRSLCIIWAGDSRLSRSRFSSVLS